MDEIFQQNAKIVYHFLYSMCRDENLAEDLTQETFLKAIESIQRFDRSCKISTWLCQIAKHLLYQHWARYKNYSFVELDESLEAGSDTERQAMNRNMMCLQMMGMFLLLAYVTLLRNLTSIEDFYGLFTQITIVIGIMGFAGIIVFAVNGQKGKRVI